MALTNRTEGPFASNKNVCPNCAYRESPTFADILEEFTTLGIGAICFESFRNACENDLEPSQIIFSALICCSILYWVSFTFNLKTLSLFTSSNTVSSTSLRFNSTEFSSYLLATSIIASSSKLSSWIVSSNSLSFTFSFISKV